MFNLLIITSYKLNKRLNENQRLRTKVEEFNDKSLSLFKLGLQTSKIK